VANGPGEVEAAAAAATRDRRPTVAVIPPGNHPAAGEALPRDSRLSSRSLGCNAGSAESSAMRRRIVIKVRNL
jgi:hypothetical protein